MVALTLLCGPAWGQDDPQRPLYFDVAESCATGEAIEALQAHLDARLPNLLVVEGPTPDTAEWVVRWQPAGSGACELSLLTPDGVESLTLGPDSNEDERQAAAIRMAWWVETWQANQAAVGATDPEPAPDPIATVRADSETEPTPEPRYSAGFTVGPGLGIAWHPSLDQAATAFRLVVGFPVTDNVQLALEGRLATEIEIISPGQDTDFSDRSLGLIARYLAPVSGRAVIDVSLGMRYGFPQLEAEGATTDAELERGISRLAFVTGAGASFALTPALRFRLDLLGAISVADRRIVGADGQLADLGAFSLELLAGFEVGF